MPSDVRVRLDDDQQVTPGDQPRQHDERNPRRVVSAARLHLPLDVQRQLFSQEQIVGGELAMRSYRC